MTENKLLPHSLILDNREKLSITGVTDVSTFNEENVILSTSLGELIIQGENLHISKLNLDNGEVNVDGQISLVQYTTAKNKKSLFERIFN